MSDKAELVSELAQGVHRLTGNAMGRNVMDACAVKEFLEGETAWQSAVRKRQERGQFLSELVGDEAKEESEEAEGKKRKRKRKSRDKGSHEPSSVHSDKKTKQPATAVESILQTLSGATR